MQKNQPDNDSNAGNKKRVTISRLKVGMYVSDLNCDWIPHGPKNRHGKITSERMIEEISKLGIKSVYIDPSRGEDDIQGEPEQEIEEERLRRLDKAAEEKPFVKEQVDFKVEIEKAKKIHHQAKNLVNQALTDIKFGKSIEVDTIDELSSNLVDSVLRNKDALGALGRIRSKDLYLMEHSVNLSVLMTAFGKNRDVPRDQLQHYATGALLHDIGKILIPDEILHKPSKLTPTEYAKMKEHAAIGRDLLQKTEGIHQLSVDICAQHHERVDGTGYPLGLKDEEISIPGKMVAIIDVYDAITADRCYHKGMSPSQALKKLLEWSGTHFDTNLVHQFIRSVGIYPSGTLVRLSSERLAIVIGQNEEDQRLPIVKVIYNEKHQHYVEPIEIDLSRPKCEETIVRAVDPIAYDIRVTDFLQQ